MTCVAKNLRNTSINTYKHSTPARLPVDNSYKLLNWFIFSKFLENASLACTKCVHPGRNLTSSLLKRRAPSAHNFSQTSPSASIVPLCSLQGSGCSVYLPWSPNNPDRWRGGCGAGGGIGHGGSGAGAGGFGTEPMVPGLKRPHAAWWPSFCASSGPPAPRRRFWPSRRLSMPERSTSETCTNTSLEPSSGR